jgi:hypothetical protein
VITASFIPVFLLIGLQLGEIARKREDVDTAHFRVSLNERITIDEGTDSLPGSEGKMVATLPADIELGLQFLAVNGFLTLGTFGPDALGHEALSRTTTHGLGSLERGLIRSRWWRRDGGFSGLNPR